MTRASTPKQRALAFCEHYGLRVPVLLAPMAGACPVALSVAVAQAGGMGALGALMHTPAQMGEWIAQYNAQVDGPLQVNLWIPERDAPTRDADAESRMRAFLEQWGPSVDEDAGDAPLQDFSAQFDALTQARPRVASSVMGLFDAQHAARLREAGIAWFATVTTLAEARAAQDAGADAVIAQGHEAGGHRGAFDAQTVQRQTIGLFALLPRLADALDIPVIAAGGIADGRGIAAALTLGASAVQIGTALLRAPESGIPQVWRDALASSEGEHTQLTRAFSGRSGRALRTAYVQAMADADAPAPAPYPIQRGLTGAMRAQAVREGDLDGMQAWAGQAAAMAKPLPAAQSVRQWWAEAQALS